MKISFSAFLSTLTLFLFMTPGSFAQKNLKLDYLIKDALVFDGSTDSAKTLQVGISGDKIAFVGTSLPAKAKVKKVINAKGLYLSPGFIDPHTHNDPWLKNEERKERQNLPSLSQGVTTVFIGSDGGGDYRIKEQIDQLNQQGIGTNAALFVGFGPVRKAVIGEDDKKATPQDIDGMKKLIAEGMQEGAFGLSTGLYYAPQSYATTEEVIELAKEAKAQGGIYDTHMRSESNELIEAIEENIQIGEKAEIPVMISHIKALGPAAWGKSNEVIQRIEKAQNKGVEFFASQYPYVASQTALRAMLLPSWAQSGGKEPALERLAKYDTDKKLQQDISKNLAIRGGDSRIMISRTNQPELLGQSLHDIAAEYGTSPEEAAVKIIRDHYSTSAVSFSMDDEDINNFMTQPWVLTGSDGGGAHPRTYGSFVRKLKKYALDDKIITLTEAINRSTGKSADLLGITNRGYIKEGYYADLVVFDPKTIEDKATFADPDEMATGIKHVFVNGGLSIEDGKPTEILTGRALKKQDD